MLELNGWFSFAAESKIMADALRPGPAGNTMEGSGRGEHLPTCSIAAVLSALSTHPRSESRGGVRFPGGRRS